MTSFVVQLLEKTLDELGYSALSAQLHQQALAVSGGGASSESGAGATMCYLRQQLYSFNYTTVADYLIGQINGNESISELVVPTRDPGLVAMVALYIVQRFELIDQVLFSTDNDQTQVLQYMEQTLFETLDSIQPSLEQVLREQGAVGSVGEIYDRNMLLNMTRESESKLLMGLVLSTPLSPAKVGEIIASPKYFFGFHPPSPLNEELGGLRKSLSQFLVDTYLAPAFAPAKLIVDSPDSQFEIPPNYLQTLLDSASAYSNEHNLYYFPARTLLEAKSVDRLADEQIPEHFSITHPLSLVNSRYKDKYAPFRLLYDLRFHSQQVWCTKFSPSGKYLVSGSRDGKLIFYDVINEFAVIKILETSKNLDNQAYRPGNSSSRPVAGKMRSVRSLCWDPEERYVVGCYLDGMVRVWSVSKLFERQSNQSQDQSLAFDFKLVSCFHLTSLGDSVINPTSCAFISPGKFIIGSDGKALRAYDIHGSELFDFYGNIDGAEDGDEEVDTSDDETTHSRRSFAQRLTHILNRINYLTVSPDGKHVITTDTSQKVQMFSIPELFGPEASTTVECSFIVNHRTDACTISSSGRQLLVNVGTNELHLYNLATDSGSADTLQIPYLERKFYGHSCVQDSVRACFGYYVEPTGEDELVVCGSDDGSIYVWRLATGQLITRLRAHDGVCNMVDWNSNGFVRSGQEGVRDYGKLWCSVGDDGYVKVWGPSEW